MVSCSVPFAQILLHTPRQLLMFCEWHDDDCAHLRRLDVALYPLRYALVRATDQINWKIPLKICSQTSVSQLNGVAQTAGTACWVSTRLRKCSITIDLHARHDFVTVKWTRRAPFRMLLDVSGSVGSCLFHLLDFIDRFGLLCVFW